MSLRRTFLYTLIASVSLSALIGIGVLLFGNFGSVETRIMMTTLTVTGASILGLACGAYLETGRGRIMPSAGIVLAIAAAIMTLLIVWNIGDESEVYLKATGTVTMLALSCSHLSLLSLARLDRRFRWSLIAAYVFVWLLTAILLWLMWFEPEGDSEIVARTIGILSILIAAVTIITPVFHRLSGDTTTDAIDAEIAKLRERLADLENQRAEVTEGDNE